MNPSPKNTALLAISTSLALLFFASPALAVAADPPQDTTPAAQPADAKKDADKKATEQKSGDQKPAETKAEDKKDAEPKTDKKSERSLPAGYRQAHELIYRRHDYAAGIAVLRALREDTHPDVANLVGFASRKLGNYDDARYWYEKALAADPKHTRTWQYYGQWHLEQGNRLKAEEHLERIRAICGTECEDYKSLDVAIRSGKLAY
jgi:tetratricopeptide (TPR) repeat protein